MKIDKLLDPSTSVILAGDIDMMGRGLRIAELVARQLGDKEEGVMRAKRRMLANVSTTDATAELGTIASRVQPYLASVGERMREMPEFKKHFPQGPV